MKPYKNLLNLTLIATLLFITPIQIFSRSPVPPSGLSGLVISPDNMRLVYYRNPISEKERSKHSFPHYLIHMY